MSILENKYAEVLADIIAERLTSEELEYLISEYDRRELETALAEVNANEKEN